MCESLSFIKKVQKNNLSCSKKNPLNTCFLEEQSNWSFKICSASSANTAAARGVGSMTTSSSCDGFPWGGSVACSDGIRSTLRKLAFSQFSFSLSIYCLEETCHPMVPLLINGNTNGNSKWMNSKGDTRSPHPLSPCLIFCPRLAEMFAPTCQNFCPRPSNAFARGWKIFLHHTPKVFTLVRKKIAVHYLCLPNAKKPHTAPMKIDPFRLEFQRQPCKTPDKSAKNT